MLPSDMLLKPLNQVIEGYNDKIVINTSGFELGKQEAPKASLKRHDLSGEGLTLSTIIRTRLQPSFLELEL